MRTESITKDKANREWYVVDLDGVVLGRAASKIAMILRGKNKPSFTPHEDTGDFVIVVNANKVKLTGRKWDQKMYYRHSGYIGGLKSIKAAHLLEKDPGALITHAVKGMLPKNRLGRQLMRKLKVYADATHPHEAQLPKALDIANEL